jgi:hexosaminidase
MNFVSNAQITTEQLNLMPWPIKLSLVPTFALTKNLVNITILILEFYRRN